jgi:hypothetical protein
MNPICIASFCFELGLELELGSLFLAAVGAMATVLHHRQQKARQEQRERHHQELCVLQGRLCAEPEVALALGGANGNGAAPGRREPLPGSNGRHHSRARSGELVVPVS